jgi:hypothetical protein
MGKCFGTSRRVDGEELVLTLQSRDGRRGDRSLIAHQVSSSGWTAEITFGDTVGPSPECFRRFASRSWEEAGPHSLKLRRARRRWSPIAHHVSLFDGRLKMLRGAAGPSFYAFGVRECERANLR